MALGKQRLRWHDGNRIELLQNGGQFFPALCAAFDAAQSSIHLETYIFNLDRTGLRVLGHLKQACERGVKVRVVLDGFGCFETVEELSRRLEEMGAVYRVYRPEPTGMRRYRVSLRRLRRLHRKMTVVDGRMAFVGGINIIDDLEDVPNDGVGPKPRFDFSVRLQGPIVLDVNNAQRVLWLRMAARHNGRDLGRATKRIRAWFRRRRHAMSDGMEHYQPGMRATLLLRDNLRFRQTIENVYLQAIDAARNEILIANAYFFPGRRLRRALEHAAQRGVRVRLLLQGRSEYPLQFRASRSMYGKLLDDGIEVYEYMASYLHAKVAVIDDAAMVGSSNMDPFSLLLAREANVFVQDQGLASELTAALQTDIRANAKQVTLESLQTRRWLGRAVDSAAYFMLRVGVALTGKGAEY
jgi:cardiolipin synthase